MAGSLDDLAASLAAVAGRLREIGEGGLARELTAAVRRATDPVPAAVHARVQEEMPHRGGYAATLDADLAISRHVFTGGDQARVIITAEARAKKRKLRRLDAGFLTHPLFGDREHWYTQPVTPGWFEAAVLADAPRIRDEINRALDDVARRKQAGKGA